MSPRVVLQACGRHGDRPGAIRRPPRVGRGLLLSFLALAAARPVAAQQDVVAGTVVDAHTGRALAGVQVVVEGTQLGALSDPNGAFRITGLSGTTVQLRAIMVGYRPLTQTVRVGDTRVRLELTETAIELNALVVTGTAGGVQKRALGNSISQVNAAQVTETAPIKSTQDLLNGRAAGVVVMPGTGMVGSGSRIRIRGLSTLSLSGDPLIYIDGVRVNNETGTGFSIQGFSSGVVSRLNDINPDDIESIEIIKGPAAATL
ncbi:MAG TPA: TonB-dependent receptor plug domain-containing protein, partial [Gemmatimonadales bacterium]|nr:TonB-dependent receptor plug domain-containing protein [Gemmatimonadales bacterium]